MAWSFSTNPKTFAKGRGRDPVANLPPGPRKAHAATLSVAQEAAIVTDNGTQFRITLHCADGPSACYMALMLANGAKTNTRRIAPQPADVVDTLDAEQGCIQTHRHSVSHEVDSATTKRRGTVTAARRHFISSVPIDPRTRAWAG